MTNIHSFGSGANRHVKYPVHRTDNGIDCGYFRGATNLLDIELRLSHSIFTTPFTFYRIGWHLACFIGQGIFNDYSRGAGTARLKLDEFNKFFHDIKQLERLLPSFEEVEPNFLRFHSFWCCRFSAIIHPTSGVYKPETTVDVVFSTAVAWMLKM